MLKLLSGIGFWILIQGCSLQPKHFSGNREIITANYVNPECACPGFMMVAPDSIQTDTTRFYIQPASADLIIAEDFYETDFTDYYLLLTGQFYKDAGVPDTYKNKYAGKPVEGKVFYYYNYKVIPQHPVPQKDPIELYHELLSGVWLNELDTLSSISIADSTWVFGYAGSKVYNEDKYLYTINYSIPDPLQPNEREFLIRLTNTTSQIEFKIVTLNGDTFSILTSPENKVKTYRRAQ